VAARIACLSSYFRFLIRMGLAAANPSDSLERPRPLTAPARGLTADQVRQLLAVIPDTPAGRRDRALLLAFDGKRGALFAGDLGCSPRLRRRLRPAVRGPLIDATPAAHPAITVERCGSGADTRI
jgi:hypothetical protein